MGLYNGFESDSYIAYVHGVSSPVTMFDVNSQHFGCNITLDSIYILVSLLATKKI